MMIRSCDICSGCGNWVNILKEYLLGVMCVLVFNMLNDRGFVFEFVCFRRWKKL